MSNEIILYDIPSRGRPSCWSLNPWKTRLVLNYKNLPYTTEWTDYPDITPKLKSLGIPPNSKEVNPINEYSIPTIRLPDGRYIMDSTAIAEELERLYPKPSLHLDNDYATRARAAVTATFRPLVPVLTLRSADLVIPEQSTEYFLRTREEKFNLSRAQMESVTIDAVWDQIIPGLDQIRDLLHENVGPYVLGNEVSYADFVFAALWACMKKLDQDGDFYGRIVEFEPAFAGHHDACRKWMEKDD